MATKEKDTNENASPNEVAPIQGSLQPMYMDRSDSEDHVPDHMILSIISIFCCCLFGLIATFKASKANTLKGQPGGLQEAKQAATAAKMWAIIGIVIGSIGIVVGIFFVMVMPLIALVIYKIKAVNGTAIKLI